MASGTIDTKYKWLMAAVGLLVTVFLVWYFQTLVFYVLGAAALSLIGGPLVRLIESVTVRGRRVPRWLSAMIVLLFLLFVFFCLLFMFVPSVMANAEFLSTLDSVQVKQALGSVIGSIDSWVESTFPGVNFSAKDAIVEHITPIFEGGFFNNMVMNITGVISEVFVAVFSVSFISYFFLKDDKLFNSLVVMLLPKKYEEGLERAMSSSIMLLGRYFIGICLESFIKLIVVTFALYFLGMDLSVAAIIGAVTAVLNVIPYVGPLIGALLAFAIAAVSVGSGSDPQVIWDMFMDIAIVLTVFQLLDNIVLQPYIYSSSVKAHPLEIFIVILMAGYINGVMGMLFAIPFYTVIRVFAKEFFANFRVVRKLTENL
ncbi:MAG: AI-2E family transporter [Rikenellaceae bacterium]